MRVQSPPTQMTLEKPMRVQHRISILCSKEKGVNSYGAAPINKMVLRGGVVCWCGGEGCTAARVVRDRGTGTLRIGSKMAQKRVTKGQKMAQKGSESGQKWPKKKVQRSSRHSANCSKNTQNPLRILPDAPTYCTLS